MNFQTNSSVASASCGHISCFWCTFKAMDAYMESHCPVCHNPYNHFPRSCELLHFLLLKLYPSAYKRRSEQVAEEEEKKYGYASPQFEGDIVESQFSEVDGVQDATSGGDHPSNQDSSQRTLHEDNTIIQPTSGSQTTTSVANSMVTSTRKVLVTDLQCAVCKQLLYCPIVLNCGHVYCETCIHPDDSIYRCPVCQSAHPRGVSSVCLFLHHFLEEYFPKDYSARKESSSQCHSHSPSGTGSSTENQEQTAKHSFGPSYHQANFHPGVGCDYCGTYYPCENTSMIQMSPIVGVRYRCKDCVERIGFDLCENCYKISSKLPGRFNQQHTLEHKFDVIQPNHLRMVLSSFGANNLRMVLSSLAELSAEDDETDFGSENEGVA